ncbi:hypothetical protein CBS101457_004009 [Exobasidium rhododendri]|nr:hypothetical protein CBS101457_004009 [Exobasidium rhododendri]
MPVQRVQVAKASEAPRSGAHKDFRFAGEGDDEVKVLLSNVGGKLHATSAKCTHYGAPLSNGIFVSDGDKSYVKCPWHGACFSVGTGDVIEAPALDSLLTFKVETDEEGNVFVEADPEKLKGKPGVAPSCAKATKKGGKGTIIIGGGSAAINCAESARKSGYSDPITIYTAEKYAPIDRTKLSKGLVTDVESITWRSASHLRTVLDVDLKEGVSATSVDVKAKKVSFSDQTTIEFENLILASGGAAKRLPLPGAKEGELQNVFTLRGVGDTSAIVAACGDKQDKDVVVVGTSFIGMEVAIALAGQKKAKSVTVIGMEEVPFQNVLGKEVGAGLMESQKKANGLKFHIKAGVEKLEGTDGKVTAVIIKDESGKQVTVPGQVVILGVGVAPATGYLKDSPGFPQLEKDGSVAVDKSLRVKGVPSESNIFACGDIATVPARDEAGATVRIEHWNVAGNHGRSVGKLLAGESAHPFDTLPIFWSALGSQLRYVSDGNPPGFDDVYVHGNVQDLKFAAYYAKKGKVNAVATMGIDPLVMHSSVLLVEGKMPSLEEIKGGKDPLSIPLASSTL